ncbi:MAG: hypothetical protein JWM98_1490 [Thermoleophilia bacterium]|nr:hypothetical protein [Thermoleophilia bacterium]
MARSPRQLPPSALDGYRRLARTRHAVAAAGVEAVAGTDVAARPSAARPSRTRRVAGAIRLAGFVAVLALIVGTSVSLAGTDDHPAQRPAAARHAASTATATAATSHATAAVAHAASPLARDTSPDVKPDAATTAHADTDASAAGSTATDAASAPEPAATIAPAAAAAASPTTGSLPLTGETRLQWPLLGGALLALTGMLLQIAGQPLPARARTRR